MTQETQKVLIADDDGINRQVLATLLKPEYVVLLAKTGEQAIERAQRHLPDLLMLDVMLPDMDGYEVLRRLRADPATAHIEVIFITGMGRPEDEARGLKLGAADYITKPFNTTVVMARVATHLEVVRQRRMLEHLAHIDGLTELANRRRFDEVYESEWQRATRHAHTISVALLDIDCFKQYNDHYGHPAGDRTLRAVARVARNAMRRPCDVAARYGGEELAILMPETDAAQALYVAEGIREAVAQLLIPHEQSIAAPVVTVSIGGATLPLGGGETSAVLFEAADAALYRAKEAGRNRVNWRM
ncbi:response regulator receiver modulated diguanylate cyclase [Duganella sp. CF458]|uniref:diguanylate cyclase n=1 Tax=Duganella sp. CF458 TaxID=1884368 RepID=UPI0008E9EBAD|nr:diguanylate cyclase [Duganella sp. CF458]SFG11108.1 response regulator receiver modulated diguanylate cyclase [Duganella sp. CF458]